MFKKIKKIIDIMVNKEDIKVDENYADFSYQWIKGENMSNINHFKDIVLEPDGKKYIAFTDGTRISADLLDEYMIRVEKGYEEPKLQSEYAEVQLIDPSQKSVVKSREVREIPQSVKNIENPIFSLLSKQKENWVDVDLKLSINLPPRSLWEVLVSSFEDAETDILEYVTKDLDIEVVRQSLRESIKEIYKRQKNSPVLKNVRTQDPISE
jgi:hypothetical protein